MTEKCEKGEEEQEQENKHTNGRHCTLQEIHLRRGGNQFKASSSIFDGKMAQSCHYFSVTMYSGLSCFGCSRCSLWSHPRYTAQLRDYRSTNREISFMAEQLFCINLRRLARSIIQLRAGVQEAYLRKSLHGPLVVKTEEEGK